MALTFINETRLIISIYRVLFLLAFIGCQSKQKEGNTDLVILWEKNRAVGISITYSDPELLTIKLKNSENQAVLGEWIKVNNLLTFRALVPFTPGISYKLYSDEQLIDTFLIESRVSVPPKVLGIYPSSDTLPENLLKMYVKFSSPMREGIAIENITVLDLKKGDTLQGTFLDLQPELWNQDNTLLTMWLDPGRIKRGLIPNETLGAPLEPNTDYRIVISSNWTGTNGLGMSEDVSKTFYTSSRDEKSPNPEDWVINAPKSGTIHPLRIEFKESLDAILGIEAIQLLNSGKDVIAGNPILSNMESVFEFTPETTWTAGEYILRVEARLEDLAGNNIKKLFDMDIASSKKVEEDPECIDLTFRIN